MDIDIHGSMCVYMCMYRHTCGGGGGPTLPHAPLSSAAAAAATSDLAHALPAPGFRAVCRAGLSTGQAD